LGAGRAKQRVAQSSLYSSRGAPPPCAGHRTAQSTPNVAFAAPLLRLLILSLPPPPAVARGSQGTAVTRHRTARSGAARRGCSSPRITFPAPPPPLPSRPRVYQGLRSGTDAEAPPASAAVTTQEADKRGVGAEGAPLRTLNLLHFPRRDPVRARRWPLGYPRLAGGEGSGLGLA
jgi:hypothetical protein